MRINSKKIREYPITLKAMMCEDCRDVIYSTYNHDFRYCKCGLIFVDGGQDDYSRVGFTQKRPRGVQLRINEYGEIDLIVLMEMNKNV